MLYKLHTNIFIVGFLAFGFIFAMTYQRSFILMSVVPFVAFVTQMALLLHYSKDDHTDYSEHSLFYTVLIYTFLLSTFFMLISIYYDDDTFLFSKADAMFYYRESIQVTDLGLVENLKRIVNKFESDDWGSLMFDTFVLYIYPSKLLVNAIYTLLGVISSIFIYRMGKPFMPEKYAFLAALAYSTSSYMGFFNSSFLKESLFVFLVVSTLYSQHKAIEEQSGRGLIGVAFFVFLIFFFRPAVSAFIVVSIFVYYGIVKRRHAISFFLFLGAAGGLVISLALMQQLFDSYAKGGDLDVVIAETNNGSYSSGFNYFVSFFGAFLGPFPSIFPKIAGPSYLEFLGAGLVYKLFMAFPFWIGVYYIVKNQQFGMFPFLLFVLIEMLLTGAVCASLELRKVMLHVPFMYIVSFYGLYHIFTRFRTAIPAIFISFIFTVCVVFLWNVVKADNENLTSSISEQRIFRTFYC